MRQSNQADMTENIPSPFDKQYNYSGKILSGPFSAELKTHLATSIARFKALEEIGPPIIPYIAAWLPDSEYIWYEYIGSGFQELLGFSTGEAAQALRDNILTRCQYQVQDEDPSIDKVILDKDQIERSRHEIRRKTEQGGGIEAVYKFFVKDRPLWLKDIARIEVHDRDGVILSHGTLVDITREMQLEEELVGIQSKLEFHKDNLESLVEKRTRELRKAHQDVLNRLTQATTFRDGGTGNHIKRLSGYCAVLGKSCGLGKKENYLLFNAVPMHDVGKLGIADSILQKPGPLSHSEFQIIKTHCKVGSNLLSGGKSTLLKVAQSIALNHHERWDGSGYPQGLSKKKIPLTSRITSICDVFDALTSQRPYKKAWLFENAVDEVWRQRYKYFDPNLVDLFMENIPQIKKVYQQTTIA